MGALKDNIWHKIEPIVKSRGLEIFDIEAPSSNNGFLRVYITRAVINGSANKSGLSVDISDCAKVSKDILNHSEVEEILPGDSKLEVSSPGINRKLSRAEHFAQAVGERVRVVVRENENKKEVLRGLLVSFDGKEMKIDDESLKATKTVAIDSITEARVDFNFLS